MFLFEGINCKKTTTVEEIKETTEELVDMTLYMKQHRINFNNSDPVCCRQFSELLHANEEELVDKIVSTYIKPSPIQSAALPVVLSKRDVLCIAPTGSGKTLVYALGGLLNVYRNNHFDSKSTKMLIIVPTKELMIQIKHYIQSYFDISTSTIDKLHTYKNVVLVSTPLILLRAIENKQVELDLDVLVIDEADKLLNKQFIKDIQVIHKHLKTKQTIMTSATFPQDLEVIAKMMMHDTVRITVGNRSANSNITQTLKYCGSKQGKLLELKNMVIEGIKPPLLVFVNDSDTARKLYKSFKNEILNVEVLHAYKTPQQRKMVMQRFKDGDIWVLITTDVLARGIDLEIALVVNYDVPIDHKTYIHRIGRTGRQKKGHALTFYTDMDISKLKKIVNVMKESGNVVPDHLMQLK